MLHNVLSFTSKDTILKTKFEPQAISIRTFSQPFNIAMGTEDLEDYFEYIANEKINKIQAFESDNA